MQRPRQPASAAPSKYVLFILSFRQRRALAGWGCAQIVWRAQRHTMLDQAMREEIAGALSLGHSEGIVEKEDRDRILGALDLSERAVEEIMLHRSKIELINADQPPMDILNQCLIAATRDFLSIKMTLKI